ncbi:hypothetical protein [Caproicibacterium amylolyticum]|uniref:Uncharacterized protein n=1 Tax=Caproicibacterium amylolyticum TaxID=2766537 RepID=A0A7G9WDK4_9FIRM|nr:hypothetical protein [Caproicibacterium amylolyticum]QNO16766.1 hypothetical protein H6X83_07195 [Caproicibacterium amylolyticum]
MKKRRGLLPVLLTALLFFVFLFSAFSFKAGAAAAESETASYLPKTASADLSKQTFSASVPAAQAAGTVTANTMREQTAGGFGFLLVLLSAVLSGVAVFFYIRHSNQQSLPIALGSERSHQNGVIVR